MSKIEQKFKNYKIFQIKNAYFLWVTFFRSKISIFFYCINRLEMTQKKFGMFNIFSDFAQKSRYLTSKCPKRPKLSKITYFSNLIIWRTKQDKLKIETATESSWKGLQPVICIIIAKMYSFWDILILKKHDFQ